MRLVILSNMRFMLRSLSNQLFNRNRSSQIRVIGYAELKVRSLKNKETDALFIEIAKFAVRNKLK